MGVPDGASVDGIAFVAGRKLVDWLARLDGQPVDKAAAVDIIRSLEDRRATTDEAPAKRVTSRGTH